MGSSFKYRLENIGLLNAIYAKFKGYIKDYSSQIKQADLNLCQSFYAVDFVKNMGIPKKKIAYLSDYINDLYIKDIKKNNKSHRSNIVLYNPKKGYTFTKKLIKYCQDRKCNWKWVPLINMTNAEVKSYLENCKVYIDFGNHPGKDRFPREAAISGCCIITGKKGAAAYYEDVPIPDQYKFQDIKDNFDYLVEILEMNKMYHSMYRSLLEYEITDDLEFKTNVNPATRDYTYDVKAEHLSTTDTAIFTLDKTHYEQYVNINLYFKRVYSNESKFMGIDSFYYNFCPHLGQYSKSLSHIYPQ